MSTSKWFVVYASIYSLKIHLTICLQNSMIAQYTCFSTVCVTVVPDEWRDHPDE